MGEHHVTVPRHGPLRIGTLAAVVTAVVRRLGTTRSELLRRILD